MDKKNRHMANQYKEIYDQLDSKQITAFERIRERKRKVRRRKKLLKFCGIFLSLLIFIYFLTPFSKVSYVNISGNVNIPSGDVLEKININEKKSLQILNLPFFVNKRLEKNIFVDEVKTKLTLDGQLNLEIKEKRIIFKTQKEDIWVAYFETGESAPIPPNYEVSATLLLPVEVPSSFPYEELAKKLAVVPEEVINEISEIQHTPTELENHRFTLYMKDQNRVTILMNKITQKLKWYFKLVAYSDERKYEYVMEYADDVVFAKVIN
ncbi:hypothetical protein AwErysi_02190 [Erysipelotrichaceae bacterium]|nr:hypothetical protein AwErysi_02190 [Erysipelotrichaceae bacterium]